jgi:tetratricopeptide (TPR) repeat protein
MSRGARVLAAFMPGADPAHAPPELPAHVRARLVYDRGLYAGALGDLELAARCYRASNDIAREAGSLSTLAVGLRTLAYTERLRGALDDALGLATASADLARANGALPELARSVALRASILSDLGRVEEAEAAFAESRRAEPPFARRGFWEAEHALTAGRFEEIRAELERNVEACQELGWGGHVAHGRTVLGLGMLPGDPAAARAHLEAAQRWTAATGEVEVVLRCRELAARIALAEQRFVAAGAIAREGFVLADTMGFGLFAVRLGNLGASAAIASRPRAEALAIARTALERARARASYAWGLAAAIRNADEAAAPAGQDHREPS